MTTVEEQKFLDIINRYHVQLANAEGGLNTTEIARLCDIKIALQAAFLELTHKSITVTKEGVFLKGKEPESYHKRMAEREKEVQDFLREFQSGRK